MEKTGVDQGTKDSDKVSIDYVSKCLKLTVVPLFVCVYQVTAAVDNKRTDKTVEMFYEFSQLRVR